METIIKEFIGEWKILNKIKRKCIHCNNELYRAETTNILHGFSWGTICLICKTVHIQDRVWNGK